MVEGCEGSASTMTGFMNRRRRSSLLRRPRDVKESLPSFTFIPPTTQENTLKLKLKLGGVTHTFQTNSEALDEREYPYQNKVKGDAHQSRGYLSEIVNGASLSEKNKRGLKKRVLDPEPESDEDEEIKYLKKLKTKRVPRDCHEGKEGEGSRKIHSNGYDMEGKEHLSSDKLAESEWEKPRMGIATGARSGQIPITRTRALKSGKDPYSVIGSGLLEFPDGLPCASSKRQKQKLSEVEQQSKKANAAQRRRIQSEKAAQEAEAEAIRKILGQDSGRKKKEEKIRKQHEERAQERAARSSTLAANTIRLVLGPGGTTMTFSEDIGLPDIFKPITNSYPPPRDKCVGPNCEKEYKYRDSKSKLPLCSLGCYKAIQEQPLIHC